MLEVDSEWTLFDANDGLNLYRALSYFQIRHEKLGIAIRDRVIVHLEDSLRNKDHAYHRRCKSYVQQHGCNDTPAGYLVRSLDRNASTASLRRAVWEPDGQISNSLLNLVSQALQIRIEVARPEPTHVYGLQRWPRCTLTLTSLFDDTGDTVYAVSVLSEDFDGAALTRHLELASRPGDSHHRAYAGIDLKKMSWSWRCRETSPDDIALHCRNEYKGPTYPVIHSQEGGAPDGRLDISTVCISKADQIPAALKLLRDAIDRAPGQGVAKRFDRTHSQHCVIKPYVGVDAEFIKRYDGPPQGRSDQGGDGWRTFSEYVSVLTFAVDKHLVIMFYVMHMIDNADPETVPMLHKLFKETVFKKNLLKVWHNFQEDVRVINNTLNLIFQGSDKRVYGYLRRNTGVCHGTLKPPEFDNPLFKDPRPSDIEFPFEYTDCHMHRQDDLPCPCVLGNVELGRVLSHVCMSLGMQHMAGDERSWTDARKYYNWEFLIEAMFYRDRLLPFLRAVKSAKDTAEGGKDEFYQSIGPGMETDDYKMAYNVGDVIGITQIFRFLTTTRNSGLLAIRLLRQDRPPYSLEIECRTDDVVDDTIFGSTTLPRQYYSRFAATSEISSRTHWQHDQHVLAARRMDIVGQPGEDVKRRFFRTTFDATHHCLPAQCFTFEDNDAEDLPDPTPIVPLDTAHAEEFIKYLQRYPADDLDQELKIGLDKKRNCLRIVGNLETRNFEDETRQQLLTSHQPEGMGGSPRNESLVPGEQRAETTYNLQNVHQLVSELGLPPYPKGILPSPLIPKRQQHRQYKRSALRRARQAWLRRAVDHNYVEAFLAAEEQKKRTQTIGPPGFSNPSNIEDPEGRLYRRACQEGPSWAHTGPDFVDGPTDAELHLAKLKSVLRLIDEEEQTLDPEYKMTGSFESVHDQLEWSVIN